MSRFVALLRGVNVGGKNKVSMPLLKTTFEQAGYTDVVTYINSGNILFYSKSQDQVKLGQDCRQLILDAFQLELPLALLSAQDYVEALSNAPVWWSKDQESKHNAIFVIHPTIAADLVQEVGLRAEYEQVAHYGQVIFWSAPLRTFSRTRWSNVVAAAAYSNITIRNANTSKRLMQLCGC